MQSLSLKKNASQNSFRPQRKRKKYVSTINFKQTQAYCNCILLDNIIPQELGRKSYEQGNQNILVGLRERFESFLHCVHFCHYFLFAILHCVHCYFSPLYTITFPPLCGLLTSLHYLLLYVIREGVIICY